MTVRIDTSPLPPIDRKYVFSQLDAMYKVGYLSREEMFRGEVVSRRDQSVLGVGYSRSEQEAIDRAAWNAAQAHDVAPCPPAPRDSLKHRVAVVEERLTGVKKQDS